ncbi:hypothetical protein FE257_004788 [Aspergillus nanangensis]|uniref:Amino acid permease/ SLC12A domain-containing protein n=1 Tax=Aspergillus nanangensis TaxID=2582783 RepID=A0AAD4GV15_ASPNN|nr:hypothetical protein FE257_004788 [Aspergillus nanangensis]
MGTIAMEVAMHSHLNQEAGAPKSPNHEDTEKGSLHNGFSSVEHGEVTNDALREMHPTFTPRQVDIISLGSNTGSAIFIGLGKGLSSAGPAGLFLAYLIVCVGVWANVQNLSEMTIAFPGSSNFINYTMRWVDPSLAFGAGVAEWLGWTATFAAEASFFVILIDFWAQGAIPQAALLSIFLVLCLTIFLLPTKYFGWVQYIGSIVKIILFLLLLVLSIALIGGAGPNGRVHTGEYWRELPAFKNGFAGFSNASLLAIWAVGDQVFIGLLGSEAQSPRFSMARAANLVPGRLALMYLASSIMVGLLVPGNDDRLLSGSGATTSPFVIAVQDAGIAGLPHLINAGIVVGIIAIALESIFLPSRVLRTMALERLLPISLAKLDHRGRPRWTLLITAAAATFLTYLALNNGGAEALNWFISITSTSYFINWAVIALASMRFRAAVTAQKLPILDEPYAWKSKLYPLCPLISLTVSIFLLACCLAAAIQPLEGDGFTAYNFFIYMVGLIIIVGAGVVHKLVSRTKWQDPAAADCQSGRHELKAEELRLLDEYYKKSRARRVASYFRVW